MIVIMTVSLFGNTSYKSKAEDPSGSTTIESFLNNITVYTDKNGTLYNPDVSYPEDQVYTFRLEFMESYNEGNINQFDDYTVFTYTLPQGLVIAENQADDIYFTEYDANNPVGSFVVNPNGTITVLLNTDYIKNYNNAQCWLSFDASLALSGDETEKTLNFPDGTADGKDITIKVDSEPGISTSKTATYNSDTKTADYTVTATVKNGDMSNVNISDIMGSDLAYSSDVAYTITNADGTTSTGTIATSGITGGFTSNIGTLAEGSTITLTYSAKVDENAYMNNKVDDADNSITITGDYTFAGEDKKATSTSNFDISSIKNFNYNWISKSGTADEATGVVNWTVTINDSLEYPMNGIVLQDVLGEYLELPDDFVINVKKTDSDGNEIVDTITSTNYQITSDGFNYTFNDTVPYKYEFTYTTPYDVSGEFGSVNLTNNAIISSDVLEPVGDDAVVPVAATSGLGKLVVGYEPPIGNNPGSVTWRVSMTVPAAGLKDASLRDTFPGVYNSSVGHSDYCSLDKSSVSVSGTSNSYTIADTTNGDGIVNGFELNFGDLPASGNGQPYTVEITYTMDIHESFDLYYWLTNSAKLYVNDVHKSSAEATQQIVPPAELEKNASVESNGYIKYTITIDPAQIGFNGENVLVDDIFDTDTMEYVAGSATLYGSNSKWFNYQNLGPINPGATTTATGVKFDLGKLDVNTYFDVNTSSNKYYVYFLTYQTKIKDSVLNTTQGSITVNNTANLYQGALLTDSDDAEATYNNNLLDKNLDAWPSKDNNARVMFSVIANQGELDLVPGSDDITIVDTMSSNLTLDVSTVKLYEYKEITDGWVRKEYVELDASAYTITYDKVNNKISLTVPGGDGKNLKLVYGAAISGLLGSVQTVTNDVYIQGTNISDNIGSLEYTITTESTNGSDQSAGASGSVSYLEINKYDSLVATKVLAGAEFELYKVNMVYDADNNKYTFTLVDTVLGTYVSDENGIAKVDYANFLNNGAYLLRETKAPSGYKLDDNVGIDGSATAEWVDIYESDYVFIFQNATEQTTPEQLEILVNSGLPVVNSGGQVLIPNQKKGLSVTATKNLVGRNMEEGEFSFKLTQCDKNGNIIPGGQVATGTNGAATMDMNTHIATSTITFDDITYETLEFPTADTVHQFYYVLSEETLGDDDIIYDDLISTVISVQVSIDNYGDMQISVNNANLEGDYASGVTFTNVYEGSLYTSYDIEATKKVNNSEPTDSQIFAFDIVEIDDQGNVVANGYSETVYNANGVIDFSTLTFTEVGDYYYKITEQDAGDKEYDYDYSEYIIHISTSVNASGVLVATEEITKKTAGGSQQVGEIVFNNAYIPMTSVSVEKIWLDGNNASGTRNTIKVELLANGSAIGDDSKYIVELNENNNYAYTWTDIPSESTVGTPITYSVVESDIPAGYDCVVEGDMTNGFKITNTLLTTISGTKTWSDGNDAHTGDSITVKLLANGAEVSSATVDASTNWAYEFSNVPAYDTDGSEIVYTVEEINNSSNADSYIVTVNGFDITNTKADTSVNISATKELLGENLVDDKFTFTLTRTAVNGQAENTLLQEIKNKADGAVNFSPLTYTAAGTYTYQIAEVTGTESYDYDQTKFTAVVTVVKNDDNSLTSSVKYYNATTGAAVTKPVFTNTKLTEEPNSVDIIFSGTKSVTGTAVTNGFTFDLYENNLNSAPIQSMNNDGGTFTFNKITIKPVDLSASLTYFITEDATTVRPGYTYDSAVYKVDVTFQDNAGVISPIYTYTKYASKEAMLTGGTGNVVDGVSFANQYNATGAITIPITKRYDADAGEVGTFEFELSGSSNDTESITIQVTDTDNEESGAFDQITFDEADAGKTFTYVVREKVGSSSGVTYDDTEYNIVVSVEDGGNGSLIIDMKAYKGPVADGVEVNPTDGIIFVNTKTLDGTVALKASKTIATASGTKAVEADQFEFTLTQTDGSKSYQDVKNNDASGNVAYDTITYTLADVGNTYTYTISETSADGFGYAVDSTVYNVKVEVTAELTADGGYKVVPVVTYQKTVNGIISDVTADDIKFVNTYDAIGEVNITANKILEDGTLTANQFEFVLAEDGATIDTAKNAADGTILFDSISYDYSDIGIHTYTITEKKGSDGHISYSKELYTVVVEVTDNGDGTLNVTEDIYAGDVTGTALSGYSDVEFTNKVIADVGVSLQGKKLLSGATLAPEQFEFQLMDSNGSVIQTVKNDANGEFVFEDIEFTASAIGQTYEFTIAEVDGGVNGYTYDDNYYKVSVAISENNGSLETDTTIVKCNNRGTVVDTNPAAIEFENTYNVTNSLSIKATKTVAGIDTTVEDGAYEFTLSDDSGNVLQTKTNVGSQVAFDDIEYSTLDSGKKFTYTIAEKDLGDPNTTYDTNIYTVVVNVLDNGLGTLSLDTTYYKGDEATGTIVSDMEFVNIVVPDGVFVATAEKTLQGRTIDDGDFEFKLTGDAPLGGNSSTINLTATNDGSGNVVFDAIEYSMDDVGNKYIYEVSEVDGGNSAYTYDTSVYTIEVEVTYDGSKIVVNPIILKVGNRVDKIEFYNSYESRGSATIKGKKYLNDMLTSEEFKFGIYSDFACTNILATVSNDKNGEFDFQFTYDETDLNGLNTAQYTYYVKELIPANKPMGYTYDETVYPVTVVLFDMLGNGEITTTVKYPNGNSNLEIYNSYEGKNVVISKVDMTNGEELPGAKLIITDKDGNEVVQWISTKAVYSIPAETFIIDVEYTLTEITAPEGYEIAESIVFKVDSEGNVYVKVDGEFVLVKEGLIVMKDAPSDSKSNTTDTDTSSDSNVKTGDSSYIEMALVLMLMSFVGIVFFGSKKRRRV